MKLAARALSTLVNAYSLGSLQPRVHPTVWIAPNAAVVGNVVLKESSSVWFGVTIRGDQPEPIVVGRRSNVQEGTVLHSDAGVPLTIGDDVTVGHKAMYAIGLEASGWTVSRSANS